ncbi:MAG TPA: hypothetical protein VNG13_11675 [Mycobacteriales bacterium]|nr:hypothetical protein [Mycobacteriales bacterium]
MPALAGLLGVLVAGIIALAVFVGLWSDRLSSLRSTVSAEQALLATARQEVLNFTSFDFRKLDGEFALVSAESTGPFKADFIKNEASVRANFIGNKLVSQGRIDDAAIATSGGSTATLIVAGEDYVQVLGGTADTNPLRLRLVVVMVRTNGHWLLDSVRDVDSS